MSAAAVSGAVRYLQHLHFIQRRSRPGDRRDHYELVHETFYGSVASNGPVYERMAEQIDRIAEEHADDPGARDRAREMASFFRFLGERMPRLIDEWEAHPRTGRRRRQRVTVIVADLASATVCAAKVSAKAS